ncbi:Hypothetical predicted protein [Mytilus galloprovincialis]|uniref:Uncharacterized protein n=1 Tax=Mytilus galloprovincialis TaxID=29158 RepID=A0A8B6DIJ8_MYTGA|nr:Hypothetical predicted protein [Mytilus galloprovincialis]
MIRCFIEKNCRNWDRDLPFLSMAMHSMVNRQTGFTPNQMMLGRETIQPVHLLLGMPQYGQNRMTPNVWVKHLVGRMQKIHEFARHSLHTSQLRQKRDYDLRVVEHKYQPGDLVYKEDSTSGRAGSLNHHGVDRFLSCLVDPHCTLSEEEKETQ